MFYLADFNVGDSLQRGFDEFVAFLPNLIGALVVLVIAYIIAKVLEGVVRKALSGAGFDGLVHRDPVGQWTRSALPRPSNLAGSVAFWVILLGGISIAVDVLGVEALENLVAAIYSYLPNVLAALAIFIVAVIVSAGVATLAQRFMGDTSLGKMVATVAPILVMAIAFFMILDQLRIAESIVTITYAGLIGAIALGSALAFGLGGRDVASRMLEGAYASGQAKKDEFKADLEKGMERAKQEAKTKADEARDGDEYSRDTLAQPRTAP